ncbi:16S rRNA (uracil(1498)-N(3))-methyltransferase [Polynucleobacter kasalickyi]|uniref:Ribosomal RNA small subunit methyltransferase E n=1 Tax=Polynucleobacter kasalickyi TaxID=1938817 RepID=A0A1W2A8Q2_9BURK|nr:16S rRNA (uracil(1498)-N(3))-methyltransferase [Polynucleobacter kasalickyi]SMC57020.1 16S rRNA (uracil1498-N3)-methyltransferase [Polynucleobacter kasalickyi]
MSHFYLPGNWQESQLIAPESLKHHLRVRRVHAGESIAVFNGAGMVASAGIDPASTEKKLLLNLSNIREDLSREASYPITLIQGLAANEKMDWVIEKAVELGVGTIIPVQAQRSVLRVNVQQDEKKAQKKIDHWQQIIIAACEQCDRTILPTLEAPQTLNQFLASFDVASSGQLPIVLSPLGQLKLVSILKRAPGQGVAIMIGPEGGFDDLELHNIEQKGWLSANMGNRILRTETAGISAISAVHAIWGGF